MSLFNVNKFTSKYKRLLSKRFCILMLVLLGAGGCVSMQLSDLFMGYSQQMQDVRNQQQLGDFSKAEQQVKVRDSSDNIYALSLLEKGRLHYLNGDWKSSLKSLEQAHRRITNDNEKAKVQLSRGIENISSLVSNDNVTTYAVPYYEQSMMHSYQALNYLYQHNVDGAMVEIRRANLVQERALKENQNSIFEAQDKMEREAVSAERLNSAYPSMNNIIGNIKNGFQNAYTFYLSAVMYEATGKTNSAYIDYKKALEIYPSNRILQQDVLRLATALDMHNDLDKYQQEYGKYVSPHKKSGGEIVMLIEQGIVNAKEEVGINLPLFTRHDEMRFFSFALPVYPNMLTKQPVVSATYNSEKYYSEEIIRVQSLAAKELQDKLPDIVMRQTLRILAKEQIRKKISRTSDNGIGNVLASLYNIASEKADTRSWSTLPDSVHVLRFNLPKGQQKITVNIAGKRKVIDINVNENRLTLVNLTSIGNHTSYKSVNL